MSDPDLTVEIAHTELTLADVLTDIADLIEAMPSVPARHKDLEASIRDRAMSHYKSAYKDLREWEQNNQS